MACIWWWWCTRTAKAHILHKHTNTHTHIHNNRTYSGRTKHNSQTRTIFSQQCLHSVSQKQKAIMCTINASQHDKCVLLFAVKSSSIGNNKYPKFDCNSQHTYTNAQPKQTSNDSKFKTAYVMHSSSSQSLKKQYIYKKHNIDINITICVHVYRFI